MRRATRLLALAGLCLPLFPAQLPSAFDDREERRGGVWRDGDYARYPERGRNGRIGNRGNNRRYPDRHDNRRYPIRDNGRYPDRDNNGRYPDWENNRRYPDRDDNRRYPDWETNRRYPDYGRDSRYPQGQGRYGSGVVERSLSNLQRASRYGAGDRDNQRFNRAIQELRLFQSRWQGEGRFDKGRLDKAIENIADLTRSDRLPPRDRQILSRDLADLRAFRSTGGRSIY
jgi:hypothetical protein